MVDLRQFYGNTGRYLGQGDNSKTSSINTTEFGFKYDIGRQLLKDDEHMKINSNNQELGNDFQKKTLPDMVIKTEVEKRGMIRINSDYDIGNFILGNWDDSNIVTNLELQRIIKKRQKENKYSNTNSI